MLNAKSQLASNVGIEGQRKADLGNGFYLNPIISGDHADPTILKDGSNYYMTFSSFLAYPGIIIWHSCDLVNWTPICTALTKNIGSVWALDLIKHGDRYYIYIPAVSETGSSIYVIYADSITGPWSDPIDLKLDGCIDPGHAVGEAGKRYLFLNGIRRIALRDDGLATIGQLEKVYEPWKYPEDWVVEMFAPEGPKIFRREDWFYLVSAVGGTAGPPTSHMVIVARSRSIHGPWQDCPYNPIIRTKNAEEQWWSRGHASVVPGPAESWWMVYHAYENGFRTLGRQTLLEPIVWTEDGWFRSADVDISTPIAKPIDTPEHPHGLALSDDFSTNKFGLQWSFFNPGPNEMDRATFKDQSLWLVGKEAHPENSSPITFVVGDRRYQVEVTVEVGAKCQGGLLLFYNERMFCGVGLTDGEIRTYNYGMEHSWMRIPTSSSKIQFRLANIDHIVTYHYSFDGHTWHKHPWQMEVSGMHHNVFGGFTSLKVALFSAGSGLCRFHDFRYQGLT